MQATSYTLGTDVDEGNSIRVQRNPERKLLLIRNPGPVRVWIGFDTAARVTEGFPLDSSEKLFFDRIVPMGALYLRLEGAYPLTPQTITVVEGFALNRAFMRECANR